jgi:radical SAM superfamily enzyme YgiQ (UPF0313 family)
MISANDGRAQRTGVGGNKTRLLLVGPYDPKCGEFTFLAPPLGVWRLCGVLCAAGIDCDVFDPNCCDGPPADELEAMLTQGWDVIGFSTTGMTLNFDIELASVARKVSPKALMVAGGMEATFNAELLFRFKVFDMIIMGEGEKPLLEIAARLARSEPLDRIPGTAVLNPFGFLNKFPQHSLNTAELRDAIFQTPYERMPYQRYWKRLEQSYRVGELAVKAEREARLAEIRSVRLITLNYCPMGCTFCSSTNFLNEAKGGVAPIARLNPEECMRMILRIVSTLPQVRSIIFQDDIFVFTSDQRVIPLCKAIIAAKAKGDIPVDLSFISTNRIDAMSPERLLWMRKAGFRVLGFGIENFSDRVLIEFNKAKIIPHIEPNLTEALRLGITPFLDLILTSPRSEMADLAQTINRASYWLEAGCEMGMYPWVIPFSGAAMANDSQLLAHTEFTRQHVRGTDISWRQPARILPLDPDLRRTILAASAHFDAWISQLQQITTHIPSRIRSFVWIMCLAPLLEEAGYESPSAESTFQALLQRLPKLSSRATRDLTRFFTRATPDISNAEVYEYV